MWTFPFGAPVLPRPPSRSEPAALFVLGAYPSALHVRWTPPPDSGLKRVQALAVDNEPSPFWTGDGAEELVGQWLATRFAPDWGSVTGAGDLNGSSGRWVVDKVLPAFDVRPDEVWFTDCLDTYRSSDGQAARIADTYAPIAAERGLPPALLPAHPSEAQIVAEATAGHLDRLRDELRRASPSVVVTLGNAAARVFHAVVEIDGPAATLAHGGYGETRVVQWEGRTLQWIALAHPGAPPQWQATHDRWLDEQRIVEGELVDPGGGARPPRLLARRVLTAGKDVPQLLATEAVRRLAGPAAQRAQLARAARRSASTDELVRRTIQAARRLARAEGVAAALAMTATEVTSVFGSAGTVTIPGVVLNLSADLTSLAWIQTRMVLEIAALRGHDMTDHERLTTEVLALWAPREGKKELARRYLNGPAATSLRQLFRIVGVDVAGSRVTRAVPGVNILTNLAFNDRSTEALGRRADAYFG